MFVTSPLLSGGIDCPPQQSEPDQGASARCADTIAPFSASCTSQEPEPHQEAGARCTDILVARSTTSPFQRTKQDQGVDVGRTKTRLQIRKVRLFSVLGRLVLFLFV